jgi:type I restriction enzyme S subunit
MNAWKTVELGEVATIERESVDATKIPAGTAYVGLENIESGGKFVNVGTVDQGELASSKFVFTPQHLLYGKLRPYLGKIARPDFTGICSTDILPLLPGPELDRNYLAHFLLQPELISLADSRATGVNLPRLSPKVLIGFQVPLPPLPEQRRIAEVLDRVAALWAKRRGTLAQLDDLIQSIFLEMFGDPATNPKEWPESKTLGEVAEITSGITKGRKVNGQATREVPYLAVVNVQDRALDLSVIKTIAATENEIERYRLKPNDLLLTEGGDPDKLGRGTLWSDELPECIHQNHVFRVRLSADDLHPLFLNWIVGSQRGKRYFARSAKQTTGIASINMTQLRGFPLLLPPQNLQREFARRAEAVERLKAAQRASLTEINALFVSLQHRAFRGEL